MQTEVNRGIDPQRSARLRAHAGDLGLGLLDIRQNTLAALEKGFPFLGHAELARGPV